MATGMTTGMTTFRSGWSLLLAQVTEPVKTKIAADDARVVHLGGNLMRGYSPVDQDAAAYPSNEAAIWSSMRFHRSIVGTVDAFLADLLPGGSSVLNSIHVRRGDKQSDPGYEFMFDILNTSFFIVRV